MPILAFPDFTQMFYLQTGPSNNVLGALLIPKLDWGERVIAYASRRLNKSERNYSANEKVCLMILCRIRKMKPHLEVYTVATYNR